MGFAMLIAVHQTFYMKVIEIAYKTKTPKV